MRMRAWGWAVAALGLTTSGCATQAVVPVPPPAPKQICVIENPMVKEGFLDTYRAFLQGRGFQVKVVQTSAGPPDCPVVSTYFGTWETGGFGNVTVIYLEINVYRDGGWVGGGFWKRGPFATFVNAAGRIRRLSEEMFP